VNADTNAAINIAAKADVMRPIVMRATIGTDAGSPALAGGS